jgi:hypothetical protein
MRKRFHMSKLLQRHPARHTARIAVTASDQRGDKRELMAEKSLRLKISNINERDWLVY